MCGESHLSIPPCGQPFPPLRSQTDYDNHCVCLIEAPNLRADSFFLRKKRSDRTVICTAILLCLLTGTKSLRGMLKSPPPPSICFCSSCISYLRRCLGTTQRTSSSARAMDPSTTRRGRSSEAQHPWYLLLHLLFSRSIHTTLEFRHMILSLKAQFGGGNFLEIPNLRVQRHGRLLCMDSPWHANQFDIDSWTAGKW
jgi:hypothetical protein